jgi:copper chaperone CopZ
MTIATLNVPGIASDHCVRIVENALSALEPVNSVSASATGRQVTVTFDATAIGLLELGDALSAAGYPAESVADMTEEPRAVWSCCSPSARSNNSAA